MTMYWERCDFCGKYNITKTCILTGEPVCAFCCIAICNKRDKYCSKPSWKAEVKRAVAKPKQAVRPSTGKSAVLEDLLKKLSSGK